MITRDEIRRRLSDLNVWKRGAQRAPHKPLLFLLALSRLAADRPRLSSFEELERPLMDLLNRYSSPRRSQHPEYPFWRLQADGLWEVPHASSLIRRKGHTDPLKRELIEKGVEGGFPLDVYRLLKRDPRFVQEIAITLANAHFPLSVSEDLLSELGLQDLVQMGRLRRNPAFRTSVIQAYEHRCAICGYEVRFGQTDLGLEAAHIMWFQAAGPDEVPNGLALCPMHHKAFDRGAIGIAPDHTVLISADLYGPQGADEWFFRFNGKRLRLPHSPSLAPAKPYLDWHRREVFRTPLRNS